MECLLRADWFVANVQEILSEFMEHFYDPCTMAFCKAGTALNKSPLLFVPLMGPN